MWFWACKDNAKENRQIKRDERKKKATSKSYGLNIEWVWVNLIEKYFLRKSCLKSIRIKIWSIKFIASII